MYGWNNVSKPFDNIKAHDIYEKNCVSDIYIELEVDVV